MAQAQEPTKEIQELMALGREGIIDKALAKLAEQLKLFYQIETTPTADDFHFIRIYGSHRSLLVQFGYNIILASQSKKYISDAKVWIAGSGIKLSFAGNQGGKTEIFRPTQSDLETIKHITKEEGTADEVFNKGQETPRQTVIMEEDDFYFVHDNVRYPFEEGYSTVGTWNKSMGEFTTDKSSFQEGKPNISDLASFLSTGAWQTIEDEEEKSPEHFVLLF